MASVEIFLCYAHEDEALRQGLVKQLKALQRQGLVSVWYDREIMAGVEWKNEVNKYLNKAQIILLLVSPDFMDSDFCYNEEMVQAMERHEQGEAYVIPVILRPVYWQNAPFGKLRSLPTEANAITSRYWHDLDEAFFNVILGLLEVIRQIEVKDKNLELLKAVREVEANSTIPDLLDMLENLKDRESISKILEVVRRIEARKSILKSNENLMNNIFTPNAAELLTKKIRDEIDAGRPLYEIAKDYLEIANVYTSPDTSST